MSKTILITLYIINSWIIFAYQKLTASHIDIELDYCKWENMVEVNDSTHISFDLTLTWLSYDWFRHILDMYDNGLIFDLRFSPRTTHAAPFIEINKINCRTPSGNLPYKYYQSDVNVLKHWDIWFNQSNIAVWIDQEPVVDRKASDCAVPHTTHTSASLCFSKGRWETSRYGSIENFIYETSHFITKPYTTFKTTADNDEIATTEAIQSTTVASTTKSDPLASTEAIQSTTVASTTKYNPTTSTTYATFKTTTEAIQSTTITDKDDSLLLLSTTEEISVSSTDVMTDTVTTKYNNRGISSGSTEATNPFTTSILTTMIPSLPSFSSETVIITDTHMSASSPSKTVIILVSILCVMSVCLILLVVLEQKYENIRNDDHQHKHEDKNTDIVAAFGECVEKNVNIMQTNYQIPDNNGETYHMQQMSTVSNMTYMTASTILDCDLLSVAINDLDSSYSENTPKHRDIIVLSNHNVFKILIPYCFDEWNDIMYDELISSIKSYFKLCDVEWFQLYEIVNGSHVEIEDISDLMDAFDANEDDISFVLHLYCDYCKRNGEHSENNDVPFCTFENDEIITIRD